MSDLNASLARIFEDMSSMYKYQGGAERFRTSAYLKASRVIRILQDDITTYISNDSLQSIPGIGESIAEKIKEYVKTGKIKKYEDLKKHVPIEIMDMMQVRGFGPRSLKTIHEKLGITSKEDLIKSLTDGRVSGLIGFGKKRVNSMLQGLKLRKTLDDRMLLNEAIDLSDKIISELKKAKGILQIEVAGSIRRRKETIGDIDILISCLPKDRKKIVHQFITLTDVREVLAKGETRASITLGENKKQIDLRIIDESEWGAALLYFTGSKEHNIHLRTIAREKGLKINEYGVFKLKDDKRIAGQTEEQIYDILGFEWIPPEMREEKGELELASKNKIPKLIESQDIKGDMQMHSSWSDGEHDIGDLAKFIFKNYPYEYIVLTDHSKSERVAGGMDEKKFMKQIKAIKEVNDELGRAFIKTGAEVDILNDGSLDLDDELLSQLDWVCASIHSGFKTDATERLIMACRNPYVCCIGHPSGRLIGQREPYPVDWDKVFKAAKETGTALEINAQPTRMDLNYDLAHAAKDAGVTLVISTDSHNNDNYAYMKLGIYIARRAWCTSSDILNTRSWKEVQNFRDRKRNKK